MADVTKAVPENITGDFFVDTTCIDCDTCRQLAPETFDDAGEYSFVHHQPETEEQIRHALRALVCCPTGSIGTREKSRLLHSVMDDFPMPVTENIFYCGFTSPKSYGASSYFIQHPDGNWLVDCPKFLPGLVKKLHQLGGVRYIFLTHSDDVGDASRYAEEFQAKRIVHQEELWAQPESEIVIREFDPVDILPEFIVIPTPGHTRGHCVLLYRDCFLFTGDHMWWERKEKRLALPTYYYWDRQEQVRSTEKLLQHPFRWVLPGHGQRVDFSSSETAWQELQRLISQYGNLKNKGV